MARKQKNSKQRSDSQVKSISTFTPLTLVLSLIGIAFLLLSRWRILDHRFVETGSINALLANYTFTLAAFLLIWRRFKLGISIKFSAIHFAIPAVVAVSGTLALAMNSNSIWVRWVTLGAFFAWGHTCLLASGAYSACFDFWPKERAWCLCSLGVGALFLALIMTYLPGGLLPGDTHQQLLQALHLSPLRSWHTPFVTALWRLTMISGSFVVLYLLKACVFLLAAVLIAYALADRLRWRMAIMFVLLFPPPLMLGVALAPKDSEMLVFTALSIALLILFVYRTPRLGYLYSSFIAAALAIYSRHNAVSMMFFLIMPIFAFWWTNKYGVARIRRAMLIGAPLLVLLVFIPYKIFFGNKAFIHQERVFLEAVAKWDLAAIAFHSKSKRVIPEKLINRKFRDMSDDDFVYSLCYMPYVNLPTWWHRDLKTGNRANGPVLRTPSYGEWISIVVANPKSYLKHHWKTGKLLLLERGHVPARINDKWRNWEKKYSISPLPSPFRKTAAYRLFCSWIDLGSRIPHLFYFSLSMGLWLMSLFLLKWQFLPVEKSSLTLVYYLSLSGVCLTLPLIFFAAPYYRYLVPQIYSSLLATIITVRYFCRKNFMKLDDLSGEINEKHEEV